METITTKTITTTTKQCNKCFSTKLLNKFYKKQNNIDGYMSRCKKCDIEKRLLLRKTREGIISSIYNGQKQSSKRRGHAKPTYTKDELLNFLMNDWLFGLLHDNWANCGYDKMYVPSVDRLEDSIGYSFGNIQIMTWAENKAKCYRDVRSGKLTNGRNPQKKVLQMDKSGKLIKGFVSVRQAERETGLDGSSISKCCRGERLTVEGFTWKYADG